MPNWQNMTKWHIATANNKMRNWAGREVIWNETDHKGSGQG